MNFIKAIFKGILPAILLAFSPVPPSCPPVKTVHDFSLKNVDGKLISLESFRDAKGFIVVFTCNHCPFAKLYFQCLNRLNAKYYSKGVPLIAISSTDTVQYEEDTFSRMRKKAESEQLSYPYLYDSGQAVARDFEAQKTPHAFVIWKEAGKWEIKYNGAVDDNGSAPEKVQHRYIEDAVDSLLGGKEIKITETRSIGCQIHFRK